MIAIPWYFAQQGMLDYFLIVYLMTNVVSLFWVPWSGTFIDKYDRKKVFMAITFIGGCIVGVIALMGFYLGDLPRILVAAVFLFTFLNYNIHYPNLYAFVQEITERENYSKMTSLMEIIGQMTTISAGALSTLLLEGTRGGAFRIFGHSFPVGFEILPWKIHEIFLIDTMTYFAAMLIISLIKYVPLAERKIEIGSLTTRLKIGWNYLISNKPIFWFGVLSYTVFLAMLMEAFYLGASYVKNHLGETGDIYANSKMAYALGAICTGLTLKYLFTRFSLPFITIVLTMGTAAIFFVQYSSHSITLFFIMLFFLGITNAGTRIVRVTYLFRNVPNQLFGRAGSIFFLSNIFFRIILLAIFNMAFFQLNNIIYAYLVTSCVLLVAVGLLIYHYKSFDLSHTV